MKVTQRAYFWSTEKVSSYKYEDFDDGNVGYIETDKETAYQEGEEHFWEMDDKKTYFVHEVKLLGGKWGHAETWGDKYCKELPEDCEGVVLADGTAMPLIADYDKLFKIVGVTEVNPNFGGQDGH
jgi:hypothetical protein